MTTIFISGSRVIPYIPEEVKSRVDKIIDSGFEIVVGDSNCGVDKEILEYLSSRSYERVTIYTIHEKPRISSDLILNAWGVLKIEPTAETKTDKAGNVLNRRELEMEKDSAMGDVADFGLVVWQSTYANRFRKTSCSKSCSKGSLRNMYQMLNAGKPVVLYKTNSAEADSAFRPYKLKRVEDLKKIVEKEPDIVRRAYEAIKKSGAIKESPTQTSLAFDADEGQDTTSMARQQ